MDGILSRIDWCGSKVDGFKSKWTFVPLGLSFLPRNEENWVYTIGMHLLNSLNWVRMYLIVSKSKIQNVLRSRLSFIITSGTIFFSLSTSDDALFTKSEYFTKKNQIDFKRENFFNYWDFSKIRCIFFEKP